MEEKIGEKVNILKRKKWNFKSMFFLIIVILLTIAMNFYNNSIKNDIENIKSEISVIESSIKDVEKDKKIQIYSLLELNANVIDAYKKNNKITRYINHMNVIQAKYDLVFKWFTFSNWELSTSVEIISDNKAIAYQKTRDFLRDYRRDKKALFDLDFVNQITWMDDMKFKVNFKIKN